MRLLAGKADEAMAVDPRGVGAVHFRVLVCGPDNPVAQGKPAVQAFVWRVVEVDGIGEAGSARPGDPQPLRCCRLVAPRIGQIERSPVIRPFFGAF
ncbi:hypothetical protein [Amycolatopsis japonica]